MKLILLNIRRQQAAALSSASSERMWNTKNSMETRKQFPRYKFIITYSWYLWKQHKYLGTFLKKSSVVQRDTTTWYFSTEWALFSCSLCRYSFCYLLHCGHLFDILWLLGTNQRDGDIKLHKWFFIHAVPHAGGIVSFDFLSDTHSNDNFISSKDSFISKFEMKAIKTTVSSNFLNIFMRM